MQSSPEQPTDPQKEEIKVLIVEDSKIEVDNSQSTVVSLSEQKAALLQERNNLLVG